MLELTPEQKKDFLERSYQAVDGLWFMKTEEAFGFEKALDIDAEVWKVMPKIQARHLKPLASSPDPVQAFLDCFTAKLDMDGFKLKSVAREGNEEIRIEISECPWCSLMEKSGRSHLAGRVGDRICNTEYPVWAAEFGTGMSLEIGGRICRRNGTCNLRFFRPKN